MISKEMTNNSFELANVMKRMEVERLKSRIVSSASNSVINVLNKTTQANTCKIVKSDISKIEGTRLFNGLLKITASVIDKGLLKTLEIPIKIENSNFTLPNESILNQKLAEVQAENKIKTKADSLVKTQLDLIENKYKKQEADSLKAAKERDDIRKGVKIEAKEVKEPSGGASSVPSAYVAREITYPKANLPSTLKAGDEYEISGRKYEVSEAPSVFNADKSPNWVLRLKQ